MSGEVDKYTLYRMDNRTAEDFRTDMFQFTEKERIWGLAFQRELSARGHQCTIGESGVDNTGEVIFGKLSNCNPDKIYFFANGSAVYIEIKTIPEGHNRFHTFKVSALKGCLNHGALILVPKLSHYFVYGSEAMSLMLQRCDVIPFFGGKPCVQPSMTFVNYPTPKGIGLPASTSVALDYSQVLHQVHRLFP